MSGSGRSGFRPTLISSLVAGFALAILLGLGFWQLDRLAWKTALIEEIAARAEGPAIALPAEVDPAALEFSRVRLTGGFLPLPDLHSGYRNLDKRLGLQLYSAYRQDDGREIIVQRGWVPQRMEAPDAAGRAAPTGPFALEVILLRDGWKGLSFLRPANDPEKNVWLYVDSAAMAAARGLENPVTGLYAVALPGQLPGDYPIARRPGLELVNNHLEYAITWFSLAAILVVIFVIYHRRRGTTPMQEQE